MPRRQRAPTPGWNRAAPPLHIDLVDGMVADLASQGGDLPRLTPLVEADVYQYFDVRPGHGELARVGSAQGRRSHSLQELMAGTASRLVAQDEMVVFEHPRQHPLDRVLQSRAGRLEPEQ